MNYLACDLGAESGRLMLGRIDGRRLALDETHRFANVPVRINDSLCWNIDALWDDLQIGLRKAGPLGVPIASISTDSWGLDYVLLDERGRIIEPAFHYRDARTARGVEAFHSRMDRAALFAERAFSSCPSTPSISSRPRLRND